MQTDRSWSEASTIRDLVLPHLLAAEWTEASWQREYPINAGERQVVDGRVRQAAPLRADIALLHGERPVAVVEVKRSSRNFRTGVQQARRYAERLDVPLAYATNGLRILDRFQQPEEAVPVVVTTSRLLSTGVDLPTVRTIVLFASINSMPLFKQTIGRGTRLDEEHGKEYFTIIDFHRCRASVRGPGIRRSPDQEHRGQARRSPPEAATSNVPVDGVEDGADTMVASPEPPYTHEDGGVVPSDGSAEVTDPEQIVAVRKRSTAFTVDGIDVRVASEGMYIIDPETGSLRLVRFEQWAGDRMRTLDRRADSLLAQWATVRGRKELRDVLREELGIGVGDLAIDALGRHLFPVAT